MSDSEYEEKEELVLVELQGVVQSEIEQQDPRNFKLLGVMKEKAILQLGSFIFEGTLDHTLGTAVLFKESKPDVEELRNKDAIFEKHCPKEVKYCAKTQRTLKMRRVFVRSTKEEEESDDEEGEEEECCEGNEEGRSGNKRSKGEHEGKSGARGTNIAVNEGKRVEKEGENVENQGQSLKNQDKGFENQDQCLENQDQCLENQGQCLENQGQNLENQGQYLEKGQIRKRPEFRK